MAGVGRLGRGDRGENGIISRTGRPTREPIGFLGFFLVLTAAGRVQAGGFEQGIPVIQIIPGIRPLWIGRASAGFVIITAQYLFAYNVIRTLQGRQIPSEVPEAEHAESATAPATA